MRIGIDVGGTKIESILLGRDGAALHRERRATPRDDYEETLAVIASLVHACEAIAGQTGLPVGIGHPGATSPLTGAIKNANSVWLNGRPLERDLRGLLARPVRLANDANCFALSEATDGAGMGARVVFGVIIGTGTGGGVVVDGRVLIGANAIGGEWGHNPLPWPRAEEMPGPSCYCGRRGCIESYLSGPGLLRDHLESMGAAIPPHPTELEADAAGDARAALTPSRIVKAAGRGDPAALATMERYHERMARALATVINLLDPDVIVLGGGLSNVPSLYTEVPRQWGRWIFSDHVSTRLEPPRHGDSSGVRGAAWLNPE